MIMFIVALVLVGLYSGIYYFKNREIIDRDDIKAKKSGALLVFIVSIIGIPTTIGWTYNDEKTNARVETVSNQTEGLEQIQEKTTTQKEGDDIQSIELKHKNSIEGDISKDQEKKYVFKAIRTGNYRIEAKSDDINKQFYYKVTDSRNEIVSNSESEHGTTVELKEDEVYTLSLETSDEESPFKYDIEIYCPLEVKSVVGSVLNGEITYTDEKIFYKYIAPTTGTYHLDLTSNDINKEFKCTILTERNEEVAYEYSYNKGLTCELESGQTYKIRLEYVNDNLEYTIEIHKPKSPVYISGSTIKGEINFENQEDTYFFSVKEKANYELRLDTSNAQSYYYVQILDSRNEILAEGYSDDGVIGGIELKKKKQYKAVIKQVQGNEKYTININKEVAKE